MNPFSEQILRAPDFGRARQERQHGACIGAQRCRDRVSHLPLQRRIHLAAKISRFDREGAALAFDHRRAAKTFCDPRAVDGRGHHQDPQILPQSGLRVARQSKPEVCIERALVKLVEQDRGDAVQLGIVENLPREDTFGDDLDTRSRARPWSRSARDSPRSRRARSPSVCAIRSALARAAIRRGSSTMIFLPAAQGVVEQCQRHPRRLASARRRHQHRGIVRSKRAPKFAEHGVDRKRVSEFSVKD